MTAKSVWARQALVACLAGMCLLKPPLTQAANISLAWNAEDSPTVAGYKVFYGRSVSNFTSSVDAGLQTNVTASGLTPGATYYFAVAAFDAEGYGSPYSSTARITIPLTAVNSPSTNKTQVVAKRETFNGIFAADEGVAPASAGLLKELILSPNGTYSGTVCVNGGNHAISGRFGDSGCATNRISRPAGKGGPLTVVLTLVSSPDSPPQVTGAVSGIIDDTPWVANMTTFQAANALPSGQYTMLLSPDTHDSSAASPIGDGYASISDHAGSVKIVGSLADGRAFSETVTITEDGNVPIYASLYAGKGLLVGWINLSLTNTTASSLTWIHPAMDSGPCRKAFTNVFSGNQIQLASWPAPPENLAMLTNLSVQYGGNDDSGLTNIPIKVSASGKVTGPAVSGTISPQTGLFTVEFGQGASRVTGRGALLINEIIGGGYFAAKTNGGAIFLEP